MDWDLVQLFVEVVEAGTMSEAARRRRLTRSAVSQRLKLLEKQVDAQLLRRTTRELKPTDIGQTLYEYGRRIALQFEAAQYEVVARTKKLSGRIRISVPFGIGLMFISPLLRRFAIEHPDVSLRVMFNNRLASLIEADIDIAIKVASEVPEDVVAREVSTLRWHFYCTPAYRARLGACTQPADLEQVGFLSPHEGRKVVLALHHSTSPEPVSVTLTPRVTSENTVFLLECALEDMGVALLPVYVARKALAQGRLVRVLPEHHSEHNGARVWIVTLPNRYPTPAAQALIELLKQELPGCIREESGEPAGDPADPAGSAIVGR